MMVRPIVESRIAQLCGGEEYWRIDSHFANVLPTDIFPTLIYLIGAYFYNFILERLLVLLDCYYTCPLKYR